MNVLKTRNEKLRKLGVTELMSIYRDLSEKILKSTGKGELNLIKPRTMGRCFDSILLNSGCDFFHAEYIMGNKLPATQSHYFAVNVNKLKELLIPLLNYLGNDETL